MKKSELKLFLKKIVTEARLLENIQDPTKEEMLQYLRSMYGNEENFKDDAEVAMYWFSNFYHSGQSSNLYSVLSTSRFSPGPLAKSPEPQSSEEMMYEDLVLHFAPNSEDAQQIQRKHNSLNEVYEHESAIKKQIYAALEKEGFGKNGSTPRDYMEYYINGFATVSCVVNVAERTIFFDRYYDSERVDSMPGYHIEKTVHLTEDPNKNEELVKRTVAIILRLKKSIEGDESILGGIDDISENEEAQIDLNSAEGNVLYMVMLDIANLNDPSFRMIFALKKGIDKRVTDVRDKKQLIKVFNKEFGGSHIKSGDSAWNYYRQENLQEGDEADAVNDMWDDASDADIFPSHTKKEKQTSNTFFSKKKATDVRNMDWARIKQGIDKHTLG